MPPLLEADDLSGRSFDPQEERARLASLQQRWMAEARAITTLLMELQSELEAVSRDLAYHRLLGEERPDLRARHEELHAECEILATEAAHVQLALDGLRLELASKTTFGRWSRAPA